MPTRRLDPVGADDNPPIRRRREPLVPSAHVITHEAETSRDNAEHVDTDVIAPNPLNKRVITPTSPKVLKMRDSIELHSQLEASTVASRKAFLAIYPEFERAIGPTAIYVQVTGGQRLMACTLLGRKLKISVNDQLASDRARWVAATAEENLGRDALNAIEEAATVAQLVEECGNNQSEAARRLGVTQPWVHQQLNLLKLAPAVQEVIRDHDVPVRHVRGTLYKESPETQMATVLRVVKVRQGAESAITAVIDQDGQPVPVPQQRDRLPRVVAAVRRLAKTPAEELGATLRAELPVDYRKALAAELLREDEA